MSDEITPELLARIAQWIEVDILLMKATPQQLVYLTLEYFNDLSPLEESVLSEIRTRLQPGWEKTP